MIKKIISALVSAGILLSGFSTAVVFSAGEENVQKFSPGSSAVEAEMSPTPLPIDAEPVSDDNLIADGIDRDIIAEEQIDDEIENTIENTIENESGTVAPAVVSDELQITSYDVFFSCVLDGWPRNGYAVFNIYSSDDVLLDSETKFIDDTEDFSIHFDIPNAEVGTIFYLEVTGIDSIDYYSENYTLPLTEKIPLYTYWSELDDNGDRTPVSSAHMTAHVKTQCPINIYVDGSFISLSSPAIFNDSYIIAPLSEVAEAIGITDCTYYPNYNSVKVKTGDNEVLVNIGYSYMTVFGQDVALDLPVSNINSLTYIELRPFVESFGCTLNYADCGDYIDINLNKSPMALESIAALESRINASGIGSSTDYLIWVNKEKFRCTVFEGSAGNWKRLKDFTVGIGAESSETITGVFEYSDYVSMWPYESYYVGPVMVFYGNYALHSTLLRYDGTPYNNNVGVKLSLGCVRCQAKYIKWMADYVPIRSRVYVTES